MPALQHTRTHDERLGLVDIVAEWLLIHCPFTTIVALTGLVVGSVIEPPKPITWLLLAPAADLAITLARLRRRPRHAPTVPA